MTHFVAFLSVGHSQIALIAPPTSRLAKLENVKLQNCKRSRRRSVYKIQSFQHQNTWQNERSLLQIFDDRTTENTQ